MISATSRYANSAVVPAVNLDGTDILAVVFNVPTDTTISFTLHQVDGSDTVDELAFSFYSDATKWWVIANANPEILNWSSMPIGYMLRIPSVGSF